MLRLGTSLKRCKRNGVRQVSNVDLRLLDKIGKRLDNNGEPPDYGGMEARVAKLEADLTAIKIDVAVIKANGATKSDVAELKGSLKSDISEAQTKIIMWVVVAIFLAQLLPLVKDFIRPSQPSGSLQVMQPAPSRLPAPLAPAATAPPPAK